MRHKLLVVAAVGGLVLCSGCSLLRKEIHREMVDFYNQEVVKQVRKEMIDYYENLANAYNYLGFGYYHLSKQALELGNKEAAQQFDAHARLYKSYSEDLKKSAQVWRETLERTQQQTWTPPRSEVPEPVPVPVTEPPKEQVSPPGPETPKTSEQPFFAAPEETIKPAEPVAPKEDVTFPVTPTEPERPSFLERLRSRFRKER